MVAARPASLNKPADTRKKGVFTDDSRAKQDLLVCSHERWGLQAKGISIAEIFPCLIVNAVVKGKRELRPKSGNHLGDSLAQQSRRLEGNGQTMIKCRPCIDELLHSKNNSQGLLFKCCSPAVKVLETYAIGLTLNVRK